MDGRKLWLPATAVLALLGSVFGIGVAWANQASKIESQDARITKLEIAVQSIASTMDALKTSNIEVKVSVQNLTEKVSDMAKDMKTVITSIR
jgi:peptidoglycan hydrolase CwlO-like protein